MRRFIVQAFAVIGALVVLVIVGGSLFFMLAGAPKPTVPELAVLKIDLTREFADVSRDNPLAKLRGEDRAGFLDVLTAINRAAADPKVKGLIANVGSVSLSMAKAQEVRDAVLRFRAAGKFAYAYGEELDGNKGYYIATAFDQIAVQPMGGLGLTGLITERLFLRGTLDKIGIEPEVERRRDYKTAADDYLFSGFTPAAREMIQSFVGSISNQMIEGIAKGRGLSVEDVRGLIDRGPFTTDEALKARLVDRIAYPDEVREAALAKAAPEGAKDKAKVIAQGPYLAATAAKPKSGATKIALVPASGLIVQGAGGDDPVTGEQMGATPLARAITKAVEDKEIKAILLRVDSPGGSAIGSDVIRHALLKARKAGKPVVVSMSGVAGSGGYWIAMSADAIIAEPATITGSIGVISLKPNVEKLAADWGANYDRILFGANAGIGSIGKPLTGAERERASAQIDEIYNLFKAGVAEGRNMTVEAVEKIAQGRVWSGAQAKDLGLVDQLGGIETAEAVIREKLKLPGEAPALDLVLFPKSPSLIESIGRMLGGKGDEGDARANVGLGGALRRALVEDPALAPVIRAARPYLRDLSLALSGEPLALVTAPVDFN